MNTETRTTRGPEQTAGFGRECARNWPRGTVAVLSGGIGAGKTTFARGFASHWGLDGLVTSPTFTLLNEYRDPESGILVRHFDLYRLGSTGEVRDIGLEEALAGSDFSLIEWPDLALPLLNFPVRTVRFDQGTDENERIITVQDAGITA